MMEQEIDDMINSIDAKPDPTRFEDEYISDAMARTLLESNYRDNCKYKLTYSMEGIFVTRIDESFGVDDYVYVGDKCVDGYLMTYKLENLDNTSVLEYNDMIKEINRDISSEPTDLSRDMYSTYSKKIPAYIWIILSVVIVGTVVWAGCMYFLYTILH